MSSGTGELSDEQLRALYAWIDAIPLSRPKRNITRDFSDGVMMAEVIAAYFPQLVELHNYTPASSVQAKVYNFETLNQRVLKRLGYQLTRSTIEDIVNCRAGVVEVVLNTLQFKMAKYREKKSVQSTDMSEEKSSESPVRNHEIESDEGVISSGKHKKANPEKTDIRMKDRLASLDEELMLEKDQKIRELQETVEILELKITKLEQLVRLKDNKIQKLLQK